MTVAGPDLTALLEPRSVAVVGASARRGSPGWQMMHQLAGGGFGGRVAAVNPRYGEILGTVCYPSLADVPHEVDLAILGVPNAALEKELRAAAERGARGAVIFASGYEDEPGDASLIDRLRAIARESSMVVCGVNCMGFINFERRLRVLAFEEPITEAGSIAWISHSGSAFSALLHNDRGLRFNLAVSAGQELTTTVADYMLFALDRPSTSCIALFIETIRDPAAFTDCLRLALERDVPVVALKVGTQSESKALVAAHTGALAGEDAAYEAVFDAFGVMRVRTLNEMADVLELLAPNRRAAPGGLVAIHDSGGERAHLIDVAARMRVPLTRIAKPTAERIASVLEPGLPAVNPLDAWGTGNDFEHIFRACMLALLEDPEAAALAFVVDLAGEDLESGYANVAIEVFHSTGKPMAVLSNFTAGIDTDSAERLRAAGVPVLEGTDSGLAAFGHLFTYRDARALSPVERSPGARRDEWAERLESEHALTDVEALTLVGDYGIPVARSEAASTLNGVIDAAERLGYPVALKAAGVAHRTEVGGVCLGIAGREGLVGAYEELKERFGPGVTVQEMVAPGVEMGLGIVNDDQFGPLVMVAVGGVLIETVGDRAFALPPLDRRRAERALDRLAMRPVLDGVRGSPPVDVDSLAGALMALSNLAADLGERIAELDVNPVIAGANGCVAVDALVVGRG